MAGSLAFDTDRGATEDGDDQTRNGGNVMLRTGKKAAGRLLDGRTWDQYPEVA